MDFTYDKVILTELEARDAEWRTEFPLEEAYQRAEFLGTRARAIYNEAQVRRMSGDIARIGEYRELAAQAFRLGTMKSELLNHIDKRGEDIIQGFEALLGSKAIES